MASMINHRSSINLFKFSCLVWLLSRFQGSTCSSDWLRECGNCNCKWVSGKKTADCRNLSLRGVPEYLNSEVQVLDLSQNRIYYLEENVFSSLQLQNLHKLVITNGTLRRIHPQSFTQLNILIELDLSNNKIEDLLPNVFDPLCKVRSLVFNGNLLQRIQQGVFHNLKYLHKIELKHNRLISIEIQAFVGVPLLSQIYLDGNELTLLRKETFKNLTKLSTLSLAQNPWNCTCDLQPFRDFVVEMNLYTPSIECHYPLQLRGLQWLVDKPVAFACRPKIVYPGLGISINTSKENVTLICRVQGPNNTVIAWDFNKQLYVAGSTRSINHWQQRVYIEVEKETPDKNIDQYTFVSRLTIVNAKKSDEGVYTCIAENPGGRDFVQMRLVVQNSAESNPLVDLNFFSVVCIITFWFLGMSMLLSTITCLLYRRLRKFYPEKETNLLPLNFPCDVSNRAHGFTDRTLESDSFDITQSSISYVIAKPHQNFNISEENTNINKQNNSSTEKIKDKNDLPVNIDYKVDCQLKDKLIQGHSNRSVAGTSNTEKSEPTSPEKKTTNSTPVLKKLGHISRKQYNSNVQKYLQEKFGSIRTKDRKVKDICTSPEKNSL
ncbi:leucine-rich repeat-containing protein 24 [Drosophila bipectinata]|uniref:leucine-rich repeat-containing protein 24 n=1 Tax=Drosophila bipectinata TaxID=42026 RepID=UPI001C8A264B|nr:leucine-rich repeat-containing protein 24 [Drosophila bipectinata]